MKWNGNGEGPRPERRRVSLEVMESLAAIMAYRRGQQIYGQKDPAEHWYRVVSGAARKCALLADGRRQILDFMLPGDFFDFTARAKHAFAVESIVEGTIVVRYPRQRLEMLADSDPEFGRLIREMAFETISRLQARILILGQMTALQKVSSFIVEDGGAFVWRGIGAVHPGNVALRYCRLPRPFGRDGEPHSNGAQTPRRDHLLGDTPPEDCRPQCL